MRIKYCCPARFGLKIEDHDDKYTHRSDASGNVQFPSLSLSVIYLTKSLAFSSTLIVNNCTAVQGPRG